MRDTDGDLKADTRDAVTDEYGRRDANVEHNANSLLWGFDNWIHTSEVDTFLRLRRGRFEARKTLSRGQWGATHDDAGRVFRNTNSSALHVDLVPTPYYARHPHLLRTRGSYESLAGGDDALDTVWPVRPTPGVNRGYQTGVLRADGTLSSFTAVGSPTVYRGDRLPEELYGNVFLAEPAGNLVSRVIVEDDGSSLRGRKAYEGAEFLASTDERFRPVYLSNAPDGTLYVVDMYRGIIQHRDYITEYLRDHIVEHDLEQSIGFGRIYRVVHETTSRGPKPSLSSASSEELVAALSHPNGWWRDTAQRLLVERGDSSAVPALRALAADAPEERTRLQALWTLDGLDGLTPELAVRALSDRSRDVRAAALRLSERLMLMPTAELQRAMIRSIDDQDWAVRRQLAATLGALAAEVRVPALALMLSRHGDDPITVDAAISGLSGHETAVVERLLTAPSPTVMVESAIVMLAATVTRAGDAASVNSLFAWAGETDRPEWQRSALVRGAEVALLGAAMPGAPARGRGAGANAGAAPCPTCPGGRAGPGGAYAFRPPAPGNSGGGRGSGGPVLRLAGEPVALVSLAAGQGELATRAAAVLERVEWPGKGGGSAPAAELTPEQQQRMAAGEEIYRNLCQACHMANGAGQDRVGASLIGSPLVVGDASIPIGIILNGKEGPIGLMPALGGVMTDEQIASVLTFIRRQWGNEASPVEPEQVQQIRSRRHP
jgi:mono/diheme cytochrome c family protein